jgi:hypothetical protein
LIADHLLVDDEVASQADEVEVDEVEEAGKKIRFISNNNIVFF